VRRQRPGRGSVAAEACAVAIWHEHAVAILLNKCDI
jgi:hypothetical protein